MGDTPWQGDACSLVEAFRRGERTPLEELEATFAAIAASTLNAVCYEPAGAARAAAEAADVSKPFGGVPMGVKELDHVTGWPATQASVVFADEVATFTSTLLTRLVDDGGAVLAGQTTASEFGGVNVTRTMLHGATGNPWDPSRTPGGSSGGSAAAVAGGLVTLATGGDGGGSIRIPAGFTGLVGLKATYGRIPRGPELEIGNYTTTTGGLTRSVRDTARLFDVANGHDGRDPLQPAPRRGLGARAGLARRRPPGPAGGRGRRLGRRGRLARDVGAPRGGRRPPHRRGRDGPGRRRRHQPAPHGRGVVDQRDGRHLRRARRSLAGLRGRPDAGDAPRPAAHRGPLRRRGEGQDRAPAHGAQRGDGPHLRRGRPRHHRLQPRRGLRRRGTAALDLRRGRGRAWATTAG